VIVAGADFFQQALVIEEYAFEAARNQDAQGGHG
jgi:hypothetical protein